MVANPVDAITSIPATLSADARRVECQRIKAEHWASRVANLDVTVGLFRLTTGAAQMSRTPAGGFMLEVFDVVVTRDGRTLGVDPHQQIVNPPLLTPDDAGVIVLDGRRFRAVDPGVVLLGLLREQVRS